MQILAHVLLLLNLDVPQSFSVFGGFFRRRGAMAVAFMRIGFGYAQRKQGEWEELENF